MQIVFSRHRHLLDPNETLVVVVDMQQRLLSVIAGQEALIANVALLCRAAQVAGVPILATTQNAARLGPIAPPIAAVLGKSPVFDKTTFSALRNEPFCDALRATERKQILLCGVETHICISQTAHDALASGYQVQVAPDALSSRTIERHQWGMERLRDGGILLVATEAAIYEWIGDSASTAFKTILPWIKEQDTPLQ